MVGRSILTSFVLVWARHGSVIGCYTEKAFAGSSEPVLGQESSTVVHGGPRNPKFK